MNSSTLKGDIGRNTAEGNSRQNNVVLNYIDNHFHTHRRDSLAKESGPSTSSKLNQEKNPPVQVGIMLDYIWSLMTTNMPTKMVEKTNGRTSPPCQRDSPDLNQFKDDIKGYIERHKEWPSVLDQLSEESFSIVKKWMGSPDPEVLLTVGDQGDWTTNLLLEIMSVAPKDQAVAFTAHMCGWNYNAKGKGEERQVFFLRDLLGQLIEVYQDRLGDMHKSIQEEFEVKKLWESLMKCVKQAGLKKFVVIIDRVDYIYAEGRETFGDFVKSLENFCTSLGVIGITVKMMIISGFFQVTDHTKSLKTIKLQVSSS